MNKINYASIIIVTVGIITGLFGVDIFWLPLILFPILVFIRLGANWFLVIFGMINPGMFIWGIFGLGGYVLFFYILAILLIIMNAFSGTKFDVGVVFVSGLISGFLTFILTNFIRLF